MDYISCILDVEGQRGIDRLKMFERQCCMDASGGEIVQLSTGKDDSNVHPPGIGEASAILVVGSPQFDSAPLLLRPPLWHPPSWRPRPKMRPTAAAAAPAARPATGAKARAKAHAKPHAKARPKAHAKAHAKAYAKAKRTRGMQLGCSKCRWTSCGKCRDLGYRQRRAAREAASS